MIAAFGCFPILALGGLIGSPRALAVTGPLGCYMLVCWSGLLASLSHYFSSHVYSVAASSVGLTYVQRNVWSVTAMLMFTSWVLVLSICSNAS